MGPQRFAPGQLASGLCRRRIVEMGGVFIDWKAKVPFEVIRGEGECAV